eukprot:792888-Prymnesium_polylepis.1
MLSCWSQFRIDMRTACTPRLDSSSSTSFGTCSASMPGASVARTPAAACRTTSLSESRRVARPGMSWLCAPPSTSLASNPAMCTVVEALSKRYRMALARSLNSVGSSLCRRLAAFREVSSSSSESTAIALVAIPRGTNSATSKPYTARSARERTSQEARGPSGGRRRRVPGCCPSGIDLAETARVHQNCSTEPRPRPAASPHLRVHTAPRCGASNHGRIVCLRDATLELHRIRTAD